MRLTPSDGDSVIIGDGTWTGDGNKDLDFQGKLITVRSENGAANCIIDCEGSGRGFHFDDGETSEARVEGITITDTWSFWGGAMMIENSSPTIIGIRFDDCLAHSGVESSFETRD